jgi:hypothetical protein
MKQYTRISILILVILIGSLGLSACGQNSKSGAPQEFSVVTDTTVVNSGPGLIVDYRSVDSSDKLIPQQYLDKVRRMRVLFTHQSVGGNILEGLDALSKQNSARYTLSVSSEEDATALTAGLVELAPGQNENPLSKINGFSELVDVQGFGKVTEVAMMKLCYVDINDRYTSTWNQYRDMMLGLESRYPLVKFVWWTMPLTDEPTAERDSYNTLVRNYTKANNKILFDIASLESHDPQGRLVTKNKLPVLFSGYTEDGGHLTSTGSERVARAWWWLMARLAGWSGV